MDIAGKTILITGANRGIGRALLEEALRRGAKQIYAGAQRLRERRSGRDAGAAGRDERRRYWRRSRPSQRAPATLKMPDGTPAADVAWLEPDPDSQMESVADEAPRPEARYASREVVRLAFVAAIQQLPPRQRAVLLLCDVVGWSAAETAGLPGGSIASINSALQRARDAAEARSERPLAHGGRSQRRAAALLGRYVRAWEALDVDGLVNVLKEDAIYTMPPSPQWYVGRTPIGAFFKWAWPTFYSGYRMAPTAANGQPAFAAYSRPLGGGPWTAHSL